MKKEVKAIIAVVLAVWFFVMGFEFGAYKERKAQGEVVDYWYRLTLTKAFTDEKEPDRDVQITYGV